MDSYADYAERAKLMTNVHAKRKGGSPSSSSEQGAGKGCEAGAASKLDGAAEDVAALGSG